MLGRRLIQVEETGAWLSAETAVGKRAGWRTSEGSELNVEDANFV